MADSPDQSLHSNTSRVKDSKHSVPTAAFKTASTERLRDDSKSHSIHSTAIGMEDKTQSSRFPYGKKSEEAVAYYQTVNEQTSLRKIQ